MHFATIAQIEEKSKEDWQFQKARFRSVSGIGKNADISVLQLRGDYFKGDKIVVIDK